MVSGDEGFLIGSRGDRFITERQPAGSSSLRDSSNRSRLPSHALIPEPSPAKAVARENLPAGVLHRIPAGSFGPLDVLKLVYLIMFLIICGAGVLTAFVILAMDGFG